MSAGPWAEANQDLIRYAHQHTYTARLYEMTGIDEWAEIPVQVTACTITYDWTWSPYVQGQLTIVMPDDATLARLDPRKIVRVEVAAGYVLPNGITDSHTMTDACFLSHRALNQPGDTVSLQFQGLEYLFDRSVSYAVDWAPQAPDYSAGGSWTSTTTATYAVDATLTFLEARVFPLDTQLVSDSAADTATGWVDATDPWTARPGENNLDAARDIATRNDLWFRADEFGVWRLTRPTLVAETQHVVRDGADGTVVSADDQLSREGWANVVAVQYTWSKTTTSGGKDTITAYTVLGYAQTVSGPFATDTVGFCPVYLRRDVPIAYDQAQRTAATLLGRYLSRGTQVSVDAVAAYWLRPLDGIGIQFPGRPQTGFNVAAITYDLDEGRMSIRAVRTEAGGIAGAITRGVPHADHA